MKVETMRKRSYTESLYYEIILTAKYFKLMGSKLFEKLGINISFEEYISLDLLSKNSELCQRDLAKLLLKDRANTGRILNSLEEKGLIKRINDIKNNRLVKIIKITENGEKSVKEIFKKLEPSINLMDTKLSSDEETKLCATLKNYRDELKEIVKTQI